MYRRIQSTYALSVRRLTVAEFLDTYYANYVEAAGCAQELGGLDGQVLIELRAHARKLRREGQDSLLRQVGGICQSRLNARRSERGVALEDLLGGQPICQVSQHHSNRNSRATNACLAVKDSRIDRDVFAPVHRMLLAAYLEPARLSNRTREERPCSI